jgi:hypothetical protein
MSKKIKFKISPAKDIETFFNFLAEIKYDRGRNFEWAVLRNHPYFKQFKSGDDFIVSRKLVREYVGRYYSENSERIEKNLITFENNWRVKEKDFFELAEKLFPKIDWPKGKYVAYSTMWGMYPRFIEDKTFQIPAIIKDKKSVSLIIAHELLHFIFFAYFLNKYKKYRSHKYDFFVWHISEIFNSIILRRPEWQKLLQATNQDYPEHERIIAKLSGREYSPVELIERIILEAEKMTG